MATSGEARIEQVRHLVFRRLWPETSFRSDQRLYDDVILEYAFREIQTMLKGVEKTPAPFDIDACITLEKRLRTRVDVQQSFILDWKKFIKRSVDIIMDVLGPAPRFPSKNDSEQYHEQFFLYIVTSLQNKKNAALEYEDAHEWLLVLRTPTPRRIGGLIQLHNEMASEFNRRRLFKEGGQTSIFTFFEANARRSDNIHIF